MNVGSIVRVPRYTTIAGRTVTQRAIIATFDEHAQHETACLLLWESNCDVQPQPICTATPFMITPNIENTEVLDSDHCNSKVLCDTDDIPNRNRRIQEEETETMQSVQSLLPLFDFETTKPSLSDRTISNIRLWKQCGDELLKINDGMTAIPYYEYALHLTYHIQIGTTVFIPEGGHIVAAEIDCIEQQNTNDDDICTQYDITWMESGEETTIRGTAILLCLLEPHTDHLQERILLNLARCLLQLTETPISSMDTKRKSRYYKSAVVATTLSLAIGKIVRRNDDPSSIDTSTLSKIEVSGLLLRSTAQFNLQKNAHAVLDVQKILQQYPNHQEGNVLLQKIQNQKKRVRKMNQRLAKHVSQWVQTALVHDDTTNSVRIESSTSQSKDDHPTTGPPNQPFYQQPCNNSGTTALSSNNKINLIYSWISLCAIALLAWLAQKTIYDTSK
jgi:hypothetical protein